MPVGHACGWRPGIPAAIAVKGMLTFAFFGADAYVSLTLQDVRDQDTWVAGVALTLTTISWTAAAWVQERCDPPRRPPPRGAHRACSSSPSASALLFGALGPLPVAVGHPGVGRGRLRHRPGLLADLGRGARPGRAGPRGGGDGLSVQLCDVLGIALGTGVGGASVALGESQGWAIATGLRAGFAVTLVVALAGAVAARRLPTSLPA